MAQIYVVMPGLQGVRVKNCQLVDICLDGAGIRVSDTIGLPQHYYLKIAGIEDRFPCAEIYRKDDRISVRFIVPMDPKILRELIRSNFLSGGALKPIAGTAGKTGNR